MPIFCLVVSIIENEVLKSPTIVIELLFLPLILLVFASYFWGLYCYVHTCLLLLYVLDALSPLLLHYIVCLFVSCNNFVLKSILSNTSIATPALSGTIIWNVFLYSFTFNLLVSLVLKWVSCRQHYSWVIFFSFISSVNWCLLIGQFNTLALNVITYKETLLLSSHLFSTCLAPFLCPSSSNIVFLFLCDRYLLLYHFLLFD